MPTITAKKRFTYAGRTRRVGDQFEASTADAKILVSIRSAEYATAAPVYATRAMTAAPPNESPSPFVGGSFGTPAPTTPGTLHVPKKRGRPPKAR